MNKTNHTPMILHNYSVWNIVSKVFVFGLFSTLLFFILLKLFSHEISVILTSTFLIATFLLTILSMKEVLISKEYLEVKKVFSKNKIYYTVEEIYLNTYTPPSASWSGEAAQIRILKNDKLVIEFNKNSNIRVFNYLKDELNVQIKNWR